jgi:shikimate 5-dehydrogenase
MSWFQKHAYCVECQKAYKPRSGQFSEYCIEHGWPRAKAQLRLDSIAAWAAANPEKVEVLMQEEEKKLHGVTINGEPMTAHQAANMANQQNAYLYGNGNQAQQPFCGPFGY